MSREILQDMAGIAGLFNVPHAAADCALLLHGLQHRGQDGVGIAVTDGETLRCYKRRGLLSELLKAEPVQESPGTAAIGQVRLRLEQDRMDENLQPVMVRAYQGHFAIVSTGMIENAAALRESMENQGLIFQGLSDAEVIAHLIQRESGHLFEKITRACRQMQGSWTFLLMTKSTLYAMRSVEGARSLFVADVPSAPGGKAFATESGALSILGAKHIRELEPGELLRFGKGSEGRWLLPADGPCLGPCAMEYVYFSRPDSVLAGRGVLGARKAFGRALAQGETETADMVIGVPDTAIDAAAAFARELNIPYETGLIKNRYIGSTFIRPTRMQREQGMRVRLNAISSVVAGKEVFLVDDSIVRGSTAARICQLLREAGAAKIHVRIAAPVICTECTKGAESSRKEELAGARWTEEELKEKIRADSVRFLTREEFSRALGIRACRACFGCGEETRKDEENGRTV